MFMAYEGANAFFAFLDSQNTMDTTAWVRGFEQFRWKTVYGHEGRWVGKPIFGVNRFFIDTLWTSEWKDGKVQNTQVIEKFPWEWFEEK
jgi:hypothetical protein